MGFFDGMLEQTLANSRAQSLEESMGSARIAGKTNCIKCGFCCAHRPCIPHPDDMAKIAKHLKLSVIETINKYFTIDYYDGIFVLKVAGVNTQRYAGMYLPDLASWNEGQCVFLDKVGEKYKCKIQVVKPKGGRLVKCWEDATYKASDWWEKDVLKKRFNIDGEALSSELE